MTRTFRAKIASNIELRTHRADGIAKLLGAAGPSIEALCRDGVCLQLIEECLSHLQGRYGISAAIPANNKVFAEVSPAALVRLLLYVCAELAEELGEARCASLLMCCIDKVLQSRLPDTAPQSGLGGQLAN